MVEENEVACDVVLVPVVGKELMNFSPKKGCGETAEVQWPRSAEHVLQSDGDQLE